MLYILELKEGSDSHIDYGVLPIEYDYRDGSGLDEVIKIIDECHSKVIKNEEYNIDDFRELLEKAGLRIPEWTSEKMDF